MAKEGGWKSRAAVKASMTLVFKCLKLGTDYYDLNTMTDRIEFRHTRKSKIETFQRAWMDRIVYKVPPALGDAVIRTEQTLGK